MLTTHDSPSLAATCTVVRACDPDGRLLARIGSPDASSPELFEVRAACKDAFQAEPGDELVTVPSDAVPFAVGVCPRDASKWRTPPPADIITDTTRGFRVRYNRTSGELQLSALANDLRLSAPGGRVLLEAGHSLEVHAPIEHHHNRELTFETTEARLQADSLEVTAKRAHCHLDRLRQTCQLVCSTLGRVIMKVEKHLEVTAASRRSLVAGTDITVADKVKVRARQNVRIDGERIDLG